MTARSTSSSVLSTSPMNPADISCDFVPHALTVEQAFDNIISTVIPLTTTEHLPLREAFGRVLANPIIAQMDLPPHRNSAMDGYAIRFADLSADQPTHLPCVGKSFAGHPYPDALTEPACVQIMTGAVVPDGADTVIMQEHIQHDGEQIIFPASSKQTFGQNIRHPRDDVSAGTQVLPAQTRLNAANLGLIASLGIGEVSVLRKPRVAFFSTGDELKNVGEHLGMGDIYDSNRYTLYGMLRKLDVDLWDLGVIPDQPEAVEKAFREASQISDVLITSGGASVGDADYISQTLQRLGQVNFWKIAMKPGKPVAFGKLGECLFFGLPGNPVSVMATFLLFALPAIKKLQGLGTEKPRELSAICDVNLKKAVGRKDHQRGIFHQAADGLYHVTTVGLQSSHVLSAMSQANCFIVLDKDSSNVSAGSKVAIIPFGDWL